MNGRHSSDEEEGTLGLGEKVAFPWKVKGLAYYGNSRVFRIPFKAALLNILWRADQWR